jgi:branched-subunit amino acid ABC-type transport system permease component
MLLSAAGLSLIFGMLGVVNLAHRACYMLGAFVTVTVLSFGGRYVVAVLTATIAVAVFPSSSN